MSKKTILKFEKDGCVPCNMVSGFLDDNDVEYEVVNPFQNPSLAVQYQIQSVPVTILLDENNQEIQRSIGFRPDELEDMISKM